jgi:hypothetical protein
MDIYIFVRLVLDWVFGRTSFAENRWLGCFVVLLILTLAGAIVFFIHKFTGHRL